MEFAEVPDHHKSEFDSGISIIYRLDSIWKHLHIAKANRDENLHYASLQSLFSELVRVMKNTKSSGDEYQTHINYWIRVRETYYTILKLKREKKPVPAYLYDAFFAWELELSMLQQKYNLGLKMSGDARYGFGGGR